MGSRIAGTVVKHLIRTVWLALMIATPLFGFWLASSLAAYQNATQWLALLVGLLLFPLLPVGWELIFRWRRSRQEAPKRAILTGLDRLVLRTLLINGLFLGGMLYFARDTAFRAVAVRGDWMFDGYDGPVASTLRGWLLGLADRLDKRRVDDNDHYGKSDKAPEPRELPKDEPEPLAPVATKDPLAWPMAVEADPLVAEMPESMQTSIETVGTYLASRFIDKKLRVKAIHDYVVKRLSYDFDALKLIEAADYANTPSQEAEAVFARRTGVCEGYARLMVALGKSAGIEIAYVTGHSRDSQRRLGLDASGEPALDGVGHAWNAVQLDDGWYLIDATWDDATNGSDPRTTYLMTPPKLMTYDHLPDEPAWQLRADPISAGDFVRQPLLSPAIGELGLTLVEPTRSQITVDGEAVMVLDNPQDVKVSARAQLEGVKDNEAVTRCTVETKAQQTRIRCALPAGQWEVKMFAGRGASTDGLSYTLDFIGSVLVNSR